MGIPIPGKDGLYIETGPRTPVICPHSDMLSITRGFTSVREGYAISQNKGMPSSARTHKSMRKIQWFVPHLRNVKVCGVPDLASCEKRFSIKRWGKRRQFTEGSCCEICQDTSSPDGNWRGWRRIGAQDQVNRSWSSLSPKVMLTNRLPFEQQCSKWNTV